MTHIKSFDEGEILELNSDHNPVEDCIEAFRNYLIDPSDSNLHKLKYSYDLLPDKSNGLFEPPSKDPLITLMNDIKPFTIEERKHMLKDYFQGEWLELK